LQLIDDLLQLAKSDAGRLVFQPSEVDMEELLPMLISSAKAMVGKTPLELAWEVEPGMPLITTDRGKLNQILINLLSNAVKFTPAGGTVVLRARRCGKDKVEVAVIDTGIGIAAADLPLIFEEFRQADGSTERSYGGVGLGLTLARRLAVLLGGTLTASSELGRGSTFTLTLPKDGPPRTASGGFRCVDPGQGRLSAPPRGTS